MRSSYSIDIMLFHKFKIFTQLFFISIKTCIWIRVVSVYSPKLNMNSIQLKDSLFYNYRSEANFFTNQLIFSFNFKIIKIRLFRRPEFDTFQFYLIKLIWLNMTAAQNITTVC